ncbi:MAG: hypothetical protein IJD83_06550 [Clostridia bacterium]|nr:hypothetical protein [Clostridia bacterium]
MGKIRKENIANCRLTFDEVEDMAMQGGTMPRGLDLMNQAAYLALRNIYAAYRTRKITREQAQTEKRMVQNRYIKQRENERFFRELTVRKLQRGIAAQEKEKEILFKLKDGLCVEKEALECIGLLLGDACFTGTALMRIKEREERGK